MERAKTEIDKKVTKLIKFIQNKNKIPKDSKRELLGIVNDLQEQCQTFYSSFQQDSGSGRKGKSDLEYFYSSDDIENVVDEEERNDEIVELKGKLEALKNEAKEKEGELSLRVKELERDLSDAKANLEQEIAMKACESKQLGEKNKGLRSQISGLELVLKEKGDEISTLVNKFGNSELGLTSRIEDLKCQLRNLEQEIGFLRARNAELVEEKERVDGMKDEIETLRNQKDEFEAKFEKKVEEAEETKMQLKILKEEREEERNTLKEEIETLRNQKDEFKAKFGEKVEEEVDQEERNTLDEEIDHLRGENQKLHTRIAELDLLHMEIEMKKTDEMRLDTEVSDQKRLVKEQDDIIQRLSTQIKDQQRLIKDQKDTIDKFSEDLKQSKRWSLGSSRDSKLNPNVLERKMEELAEDFRMRIEDHIRILYRRIHVAEQIHLESKNDYIKTRDAAQENRENKESLSFLETQFKKIKEVSEKGYLRSMEKLEEGDEQTKKVAKLAKDIDTAKLWAREKKSVLETLSAELECKEAQESLLKEKMSKLEKKLAEEGTEKMNLAKVLRKFETRIKELEMNVKGREVELLSLGEEKREAIRQLCVHVDYQRDRYNELKKSTLKG